MRVGSLFAYAWLHVTVRGPEYHHSVQFSRSVMSDSLRPHEFASLGRFIPRYFILFDAMVNGIILLISLSDLSLQVYRNGTNI